MDTKQCSKCKEVKALSEFNTRSDRKSGYRSECKKCQYKIQHKNRPYNKKINQARCAVNYALKVGKLEKPKCCMICKKHKILYAHHPDYSNKLNVIWLCIHCHIKLHQRQCILCA